VCEVCVQPGEARPVRAGVQPWQLPAPLRAPERGLALVAFEHTTQAHKDWGQDYQSLQDDVFQMAEVAVPEKLFLLDAIENSPPGQGLREGTHLESVKDGDRKQGGFKCGTTVSQQRKPSGLEVTWKGQSASMPQNPANRAGKAQIMIELWLWKRYMKDVGSMTRTYVTDTL